MSYETSRGREVSDNVRSVCRVLGPLCFVIAVVMIGVSIVDFFQFANQDPRVTISQMRQTGPKGPQYFWLFFAAMPFFLAGGIMTNIGYMGIAGRYMARELAPAGKVIADAVLGGREIRPGPASDYSRTCPQCATSNDADAKFCKQCGEALATTSVCPACGKLADADAQFCSHCGEAMQ